MKSDIKLKKVNLHYSLAAYHEKSLKKFVFEKISRKSSVTLQKNIHALKNIDLEIKQGERVALIGHNGAGKSTLLRTIAGLYPISSGDLKVKGRVRALFELSLGFEPDATGRENIIYRSLLLGKKPREISVIQDEIIEFAGLGEFIDYPVKTYSAGMLVKLAFSISTYVEGEILLLDEVIAAGDAAFMQKANARINALIKQSEILVFASHDLESVKSICNRAIVLNRGQIVFDGDVSNGINFYLSNITQPSQESEVCNL